MRVTLSLCLLLASCPGEKDTGSEACEPLNWCWDLDGDGHGDPLQPEVSCDLPADRSSVFCDDCDDQSPVVFPGAQETCDGVDEDCDGEVDEAGAVDAPTWVPDRDGDGWGGTGAGQRACEPIPGSTTVAGDCDDSDASVYPGAQETCDGVDEDCDGQVDTPVPPDAPTWYPDQDGDGWGAIGAGVVGCDAPSDLLSTGGDCDDTSALVHPGALEQCENGTDDDCDESAGSCGFPAGDYFMGLTGSTFYSEVHGLGAGALVGGVDADGDGLGDVLIGTPGGDDYETEAYIWLFAHVQPGSHPLSEATATLVLPDDGRTHPAISNVTGVGDCDGDGFGDFLVGVSGDDALALNAGAVYLWRGPVIGDHEVGATSAALLGTAVSGNMGWAVAPAGDQDGDGLGDLLVGNEGKVYVFAGSLAATATKGSAFASISGGWERTFLGTDTTLAYLGDTDGDGQDDVAAGAPSCDWEGGSGAVFVFRGPLGGTHFTMDADALLVGSTGGDSADRAGVVAGAGDVNADGFDDLIVGAANNSTGAIHGGAAWLVTGPLPESGELADVAAASFYGYNEDYRAGSTVAGGTDVDSDGYDDLLVGSPEADAWISLNGVVYLFLGPTTGTYNMDVDADARLLADTSSGARAGNVATPGDVDGDGAHDILVGGPYAGTGEHLAGAAWLVPGAVGW